MRLTTLLLLVAGAVSAQDSSEVLPGLGVEAYEALAEDDATGTPEVLLDDLEALRENPIDVNTATADQLGLVPGISPILAFAIVEYRNRVEGLRSLPELRQVEGMTADRYRAARPYLRIGQEYEAIAPDPSRFPRAPTFSEVLRGIRPQITQRFQRRLQTARGYRDPPDTSRTRAYAGGPERIYTRIQVRYRRQVSLNLTLEKDPGEPFRWDPETETFGYDHITGHIALLDAGRIDALVIGDFVPEFGQGVAFWQAAGFGKGPQAVTGPLRRGRGIRPYGSVEENRFLRGVGASISITPELVGSAFASRRTLDASVFEPDSIDIVDPDIPQGAFVTSLGETGLHRTDSEITRKNTLGETLVGGGVEFRHRSTDLVASAGFVGSFAAYDAPLAAGDRPDELFEFDGDRATTLSVYGDIQTKYLRGALEVARSPEGSFGGIAGLQAELGGGLETLVLGRHYPAGFTMLHGYPFGERNGSAQNETGLYLGLRLRPSPSWTLSGYLDVYRFPWLRFNVPRPSTGHEALLFAEYRPRSWLRAYLQLRTETKEATIRDVPNQAPGSTVRGLGPETRQTFRLQGEWLANRNLRFRTRVEWSRYVPPEQDEPTGFGALLFQDVRWQVVEPLRIDARLTLFRSDGFGSRLYQFENDLTGVFAIPVLSGRGARGYVLLTAEPLDALQIQLKFAVTWFRDRRTVGSGNDEIEGSSVSDLGIQVRWRF